MKKRKLSRKQLRAMFAKMNTAQHRSMAYERSEEGEHEDYDTKKPKLLVIFGKMPQVYGDNIVEITKIFPEQLSQLKKDKRIEITKIEKRY